MKHLYTMQPPKNLRYSLMSTDTFFVPNSSLGIKTAAYLEDASDEERNTLFKLASEEGGNLAKAYTKATNKPQVGSYTEDDVDEDEEEYEFSSLAEDSSEVEDDEDKDDDDDEDE